MSLSAQILLSLGLGGAAGLFFGELMSPLEVVGDVFIRLLQMTVLPYVVVSLVSGLGRLDYAAARRLGVWFLGWLVVVWVVSFGLVMTMPLAFPKVGSASSFFSTSLVEPPREMDFVGLYIPTNPFYAMANNVVPAVVLFSVSLGFALIGLREKDTLLRTLETLAAALLRVADFVVRLTPIGVFAISASAAGTLSVEEFSRVQVYLFSYIGFALLATFWVLPGLVAALTPIDPRRAVAVSRDALITAFATGSSFVVIPILAENSRTLLAGPEEDEEDGEKVDSIVDVVIPASQNFPHAAKVLTLSFIVFAGWFDDSPVPLSDYPFLFLSGVASTFGSVNVAIPFLLDQMQLPHDLFRLFVATSVLNARFGTLLQAMHMLVLTLLTACALTGRLRVDGRRIAGFALGTLALLAALIGGGRLLFSLSVEADGSKRDLLAQMQPVLETTEVVLHATPPEYPPLEAERNRLEGILHRRSLRVCYPVRDLPPFSYRDGAGGVKGLDIEMAHSLARGLESTLELVPLEPTAGPAVAGAALDSGLCDLSVTRTVVSMDDVGYVARATPHLEFNMGFLVRDHRRREFADLDAILQREDLRLAIPDSPYFVDHVARRLPKAALVPIHRIEEFLQAPEGRFDGLVYLAETAAIWSLVYPEFGVVVPSRTEQVPLAFMLPLHEPEWENAVDTWIALKRADGTIEQLYDHWILGRNAARDGPRWSVLRDVLGWID